MTSSSRSHVIVSQQLVPGLINALINGWIAWKMHQDAAAVHLWGEHGYATDLVATGVLLPGITWLILWPLLFKQAAAGKAPATDGLPRPWASGLLPGALWRGAVAAGILGGLIGLLVVGVMHWLGAPSMPGTTYAVFKGLYGGLLPVLLQPSMVWAILARARLAPALTN